MGPISLFNFIITLVFFVHFGKCEVDSNNYPIFSDLEWLNCNESDLIDTRKQFIEPLYSYQLDQLIKISIDLREENFTKIDINFQDKRPACQIEYKMFDLVKDPRSIIMKNGKIVISTGNPMTRFSSRDDYEKIIDPTNCTFVNLTKPDDSIVKRMFAYENTFDVLYKNIKNKSYYVIRYRDNGEILNNYPISVPEGRLFGYTDMFPSFMVEEFKPSFLYLYLDRKQKGSEVFEKFVIYKLDSDFTIVESSRALTKSSEENHSSVALAKGEGRFTMCKYGHKIKFIKCKIFDSELKVDEKFIEFDHKPEHIKIFNLKDGGIGIFWIGKKYGENNDQLYFGVDRVNKDGDSKRVLMSEAPGDFIAAIYKAHNGSYCAAIQPSDENYCKYRVTCTNILPSDDREDGSFLGWLKRLF